MTEVLAAALAGVVAGVLHVLSGPDHLAAVLPFAVGGRRQALRVGATWGLGHGLGVLLLGAAAVVLRSTVDLEAVSGLAEVVVGVMLMLLGAWAIRRSRWVRVHAHAHEHDLDPTQHDGHTHPAHEHEHEHGHPHAHGRASVPTHPHAPSLTAPSGPSGGHDRALGPAAHAAPSPAGPDAAPSRDTTTVAPLRRPRGHHRVRTPHVHVHLHLGAEHGRHEHPHSVLGFGLLHGLAGAGHLLGVLPSLALGQSAALAYLGAFLVGGLGAMSIFAFVAGRLVRHDAWVPRALALAGATSMAIGAAWIATSTGLVTLG